VKLAEQMKKIEQETVSVSFGAVTAKPAPAPAIFDVKQLLESVTDGSVIDTQRMVEGLDLLAKKQKLSEKEALTAIKMVEFHGDDLEALPGVNSIGKLSERVRTELGSVLKEKGISARKLKDAGL
jgi:hypothetical protein